MRIFILLLISVSLISCKSKSASPGASGPDCTSQSVRYMDSEIQKFKFKMGSYWVFMDPIYPIIDTMRLTSVSFDGLTNYEYCPNNKYEYYEFSLYSSYFTNSNTYTYYLSDSRVRLSQLNADYNGIFTTTSIKIDSVFIYDRYYKSVGTYKVGSNKYYINADFGFLKLEVLDNAGNVISQKLLKDKLILR